MKLLLAIKKEGKAITVFKDERDAKFWNKKNKNWKYYDLKSNAAVMKALPQRSNLVEIEK